MYRRKPCAGKVFRPSPDAAEMPGVAQGHRAESRSLHFGGRQVHGLARDHLSIPEPAVDERMALRLAHDRRMPVGEHHAARTPVDVLGHPDDAMGIVPGEVGIDKMIADDARLLVG